MNTSVFSSTPAVIVNDPRGLAIRELAYYRHPDTLTATDTRITRHQFDSRGLLSQSTDPRLHGVNPNYTYHTALSGAVLRTDSVDAGTVIAISDAAGRPVLAINAARTRQTWQYEENSLPGRLLSIMEQSVVGDTRITERFVYAGNTASEQALNLAGQCVRHYDTAGRTQLSSLGLTKTVLSQTYQLLADGDNAGWPDAGESAWERLLADVVYETRSTADSVGAVLTTTDAAGNCQRAAYDVAGQLKGSWLTLNGGTEQAIIKSLTYSAAGNKLREEQGNGVVTTYTYEPQTQRLICMKTERPARHPSGAKILQDLRYQYDPVGNVLKVVNDAEATRFWRNQQVVPENTYTYDSLYQLVSATGREMAGIAQQGNAPPSSMSALITDPTVFTAWVRHYEYDVGGNLFKIRHHTPATNRGYTTDITISNKSNRAVLNTPTSNMSAVDVLFSEGGHLRSLQPGQNLTWTSRGELAGVTLVARQNEASDTEAYYYSGNSQRVLKVSMQKTGNAMQKRRAVYLPGLELRSTANGNMVSECLQIISVGLAGHAQVRVLHWEGWVPAGLTNDTLRYSYDNLLGSSGLEVDGDGNVIRQEEYYPYGGTAVLAARSQVEVGYKTIRYSGKEQDSTGLYYYGYRYYQPWVGRWLSADPAGTVDGLNLFRMVRNNPVVWKDNDGRAPVNNMPAPPPPPPPPPAPGAPPPPAPGAPPPPAPGAPPPPAPGAPPPPAPGAPPPPAPGAPPPPAPGVGMSGTARNTVANTQKTFVPIVLAHPVMPGDTASAPWCVEDYVDTEVLSKTISSMFGIEKRDLKIESVSHEEAFNQIRTVPGNESMVFNNKNLNSNPAAWTSPQGTIYMGTTAPDYSSNGSLDADKIRSTIIHESIHASSYEHTGFQKETDTSLVNSNYDEYVTDFFAKKVFDKMFQNATYKTAYFTTNVGGKFMHWGGNLPKFMIDSGHITGKELSHNYFNTGKLSALADPSLTAWKNFAKQNRNPLNY